MTFEPQTFFIGLMEFFSILLPGALLTFLLMGAVGPLVFGSAGYGNLAGAEGWVAFLVASYLSGHLVFLLGSWLDELYELARRRTLNMQISQMARRGTLLPLPVRVLIWLVFKKERDLAFDCAKKIKRQELASLQAEDSVNTFQWCMAILARDSPEGLAVVQRFEADSKFFRSFVVVLLLLVAAWPLQHRWPLTGIGVVLLLLVLALWRYMEQRFKATNHACWRIITLTARAGKAPFEKTTPPVGATHAGGVVFRRRQSQAEYLLLEAKDDPSQWVLPKGHIEDGEQPRQTAVREVHEETGAWAKLHADLGRMSYSVDGAPVSVQFFLMEYVGRGLRTDRDRKTLWLSLDNALATAIHPETREMLTSAEKKRVRQ